MWLTYAVLTFVLWGVWGAFINKPTENHFPETLSYVVWALTTIPPMLFVLAADKFKLATHGKAVFYGMVVGLTGCGGQVALFKVVPLGGPPHLVFPILALAPVITVIMSFTLLGERTGKLGAAGVVLALVSIVVLSMVPAEAGQVAKGHLWLIITLAIMVAWGVQAYYMKIANNHMSSGSVCFYNTMSALLLAPIAVWMTYPLGPINWGVNGPWLAAIIQVLNAIGFVTYVLAFKYGKAIIVAPLGNAFPLLTVFITLGVQRRLPTAIEGVGIVVCMVAATFMVLDEQWHQPPAKPEEGGAFPVVETAAERE